MKIKKVKVNVSLSEGVLLSIDTHARAQGLSRSAYITKLENDESRRISEYMKKYQNDDLDYYYDLPVMPGSMLYKE